MKGWLGTLAGLSIGVLLLAPPAAGAQVHHDLTVTLAPAGHRLSVTDTITLMDDAAGNDVFLLHPALTPTVETGGVELQRVDAGPSPDAASSGLEPVAYRLRRPSGVRRFTVSYQGIIHHRVTRSSREYARGFSVSPGLISADGVFLAASSYWYPYFPGQLLTFDVDVRLPPGWRSVSQGERRARDADRQGVRERWRVEHPQEEIYLVAAEFTEYRGAPGPTTAMAFLRKPDAQLAQRYLEVTGRYLQMYDQLLGPYPYEKFALVENFWETGYGMPSFTLLGSAVIRLPFILHSSYPHEILHNWWGNGVYVDYAGGNWSEGLTSYLADHLIKEQHGQGVAYRRTVLQKYTDYTNDGRDFPLSRFRGRHDAPTEAVGYGKTLMLFHMLRVMLGDDAFVEALRRFYATYKFKVAGFEDVRAAFQAVAGGDEARLLPSFFEQWVRRTGAPTLEVGDAVATQRRRGYTLKAVITQTQSGEPYALDIPVAVHLAGRPQAFQTRVRLSGARYTLQLKLPARPVRLDVDPQFDVFRRVHPSEIPPALSGIFGAERVLIVLPADAPRALRKAYRRWADSRAGGDRDVEIRVDRDVEALPADRAVWLLGWENRFRADVINALAGGQLVRTADGVSIAGERVARDGHAVVVTARRPDAPRHALAWLAASDAAAMPGLIRKLPHYGQYSYLAFQGTEPENVLKGQWPVTDSPLSVRVRQADGTAAADHRGTLAPRRPLAELPPAYSAERMLRDIRYLAADARAGRGLGSAGLAAAGQYIAEAFAAAGLVRPYAGGTSYFQTWSARAGEPPRPMKLKNVVGVIPGTDPRLAGESVVIGAHYDHLGRGWPEGRRVDAGKIHPGADDNASGVAVMLELARVLAAAPRPPRALVFAAFTGEEAGRLGSRHYVQSMQTYPASKVVAMINLDTVGRLGDRSLTVFGTGSAREWPHIFRGAAYLAGLSLTPIADDIGSSDQTSFLEAGVPAVQLFSGAHADYHRPGDRADKIDAAGLVKVAAVAHEASDYLAARATPLTGSVAAPARPGEAGPRRVTLGTVPDFAYSGPGVRLAGVTPDTPAARAGLRAGDVLLAVNGEAVQDLRAFSATLAKLAPGAEIGLRLRRDGDTLEVRTRVVAR